MPADGGTPDAAGLDERFAALAFRYLEGTATPEEGAALASLLRTQPECLADYAAIARLHGHLSEMLTVRGVASVMTVTTVREGDDAPLGSTTALLRRPPGASAGRRRIRGAPKTWPAWAAVGALAAALVLFIGGMILVRPQGDGGARLARAMGDDVSIARAGVRVQGPHLRAGDRLFTTTPAEVLWHDGSRLAFAADSEAILVDADRCELVRGAVRVSVHRSRSPLAFVSAEAEVEAAEGAFSVAVAADRMRVEVARGTVRMRRLRDGTVLEVPALAWAEVSATAPFAVQPAGASSTAPLPMSPEPSSEVPPPGALPGGLPSSPPPSSPAPAAPPAPPPPSVSDGFIGINLGGPGVTIAGRRWLGEDDAIAAGMVIRAPERGGRPDKALIPVPEDSGIITMLGSGCYALRAPWGMSVPVADGRHAIAVWLVENYHPAFRRFALDLEGRQVADDIGAGLQLQHWRRYGPWTVDVRDGRLDLDLRPLAGDASLQGLEIQAVP